MGAQTIMLTSASMNAHAWTCFRRQTILNIPASVHRDNLFDIFLVENTGLVERSVDLPKQFTGQTDAFELGSDYCTECQHIYRVPTESGRVDVRNDDLRFI